VRPARAMYEGTGPDCAAAVITAEFGVTRRTIDAN
jgi:hypothetical protein